jgi:hypothetical protein
MSEIKHTPGPWTFDPNGGLPVIQIYCSDNKNPFHGSRSDAEQIANAVLMAAAPDMFDALESIRSRFTEAIALGLSAAEAYDSFYQEIVDEAIAKATGSQS